MITPIYSPSLEKEKGGKSMFARFSALYAYVYHIISVVDSMDSTAQTGQPSGGDWQEEVYQKVICYFRIFIY